jgi:hypothetical protein
MISVERAKEIGEFVEQYGFDVAKAQYKVSDDSLNRYLRLFRKVTNNVPKESTDVKTIQDALIFGNTDAFPGMRIQSATVNSWGSIDNPNKQVKVKLTPDSNFIDTQAIIEDFRKELNEYKYDHKPVVRTALETDPHALLIALSDLHHGLLSWINESGADYDIKISEQRIAQTIKTLVGFSKEYPLDKIYIVVNGDFFNSEGLTNATTGGTKQSDDSRWQKVFSTGWKILRHAVDFCKQYADVELIVNSGNHDHQTAYYLGEVLSAWYDNDRHVTVDNSPMHYKYKQYGKTLIGLSHGDGSKQDQLPLIMATDVPAMWATTEHRYYLIGHYHAASSKGFQTESEKPGCTVIVCPAISSASDWSFKKGYRSIPEAQAFLFHKINGRVATFHYRA